MSFQNIMASPLPTQPETIIPTKTIVLLDQSNILKQHLHQTIYKLFEYKFQLD